MSDSAATPETGPAGGLMSLDDIVDRLDAEEAANDTADTGAADPPEPTARDEADPDAGDDQSDSDEPDQQQAEPPKYRVKVNGAEIEVPLDELKAGYSRLEDYKAKTAALARDRDAVKAKEADLTARAQQIDQMLAQAPFDPVLDEGSKTDWLKLAQEDPAGYVQRKAAFEARLTTLNMAAQERQRIAAEQHQEAMVQSKAALSEALPEWQDEAKQTEIKSRVAKALLGAGFQKADLNGVTDHRVVVIANKAALYDELMAARQSAEAKRVSSPPPKVMRPGTSGGPKGAGADTRALLKQAQHATRTDDRVDAVMRLLESE